jgi:hypothetical protein
VVLQAIDQPGPVVGRFDGDLGDLRLVGFEQFQHLRQIAGEFFVQEASSVFVHQAAKGVVAVQVDYSHNLHRGSPVG